MDRRGREGGNGPLVSGPEGDDNRSVSFEFDTMTLPDDPGENRGSLNQKVNISLTLW